MDDNIRGIECSLYNGRIKDLLKFLSCEPFEFYVQRIMQINDKSMKLPQSLFNFKISSQDLENIAKNSIWELVLHIYPLGANNQVINTYDDFIQSPCICCLIFYDCGLLDVYLKDIHFREKLYDILLSLEASDINLITDTSNSRTYLHL